MTSRRSKWVSGIGVVLVSGGLLIAGYGSGVTPAGAAPPDNPITVVIAKLDQILAALTRLASGGAGNHTLRWDTNNPSATRFTTAFTGAVLDQNTGLVWEQAPDAYSRSWGIATHYCANKNVGGTVGWRLPSVIELKGFQDPSLGAPLVPASIFTNVQSADYWSATTIADSPANAWIVDFFSGYVGLDDKTDHRHVWCVRGGMHADTY